MGIGIKVNFTESDIQILLERVQSLPQSSYESSDFPNQESVFIWTIDGIDVEVTVGDDE